MSARTKFVETEALLIAIEDSEADSGAYAVDAYLDDAEHFTERELRVLCVAADVLSDRAWKAYQRRRALPARVPGGTETT